MKRGMCKTLSKAVRPRLTKFLIHPRPLEVRTLRNSFVIAHGTFVACVAGRDSRYRAFSELVVVARHALAKRTVKLHREPLSFCAASGCPGS